MEWKDIFNYGVPTGLLLVFLAGIWKVALWMRDHVVEPVVKNHLKLIDSLQEHLPKQTDAVDAQTAMLGKQNAILDDHTRLLQDRTGMFDKIIDNQGQIIATEGKVVDLLDEVRKKVNGGGDPKDG